jgi:hypothetical protein
MRSREKLWTVTATLFLLWVLFAQALGAARAASITFDEGPHLAIGYATLRTRDLRLQPVHIHPPLANMLAAAPLLLDPDLPDPRAIDGWEINSLSAIADAVVWQNPHPARLAFAGRLPIILLTMLAGALVWRWAADLPPLNPPRLAGGKGWGGPLALALYTLDPNILAHGSLITTDMAVTLLGLAALFLLHRHLRHPTHARQVGMGLALGMGLASKVSAVLPVLVVGIVLLLKRRRQGWWDGLVIGLVTLLTLWAAYSFELHPFPLATHVEIYRSLQEHYNLGHPAFLMGQNSDTGWWTYFPVAFIIKTPLPVLLLLGAAVWTILFRRHRSLDLTLSAYPILYAATSLFSSVNIGYRHLLPVLPFLYIFIGSRVSVSRFTFHVSRFTLHALRFTLCISLAWLALGAARVYPYPLTFFNELAGGPAGGYRWLVDSNLDWGQNLWDLRDWMRENEVERVYYSHYSPARPESYGITADRLPPDPHAAPFAPLDPAPGWYAIGATTLQGVYTPDVNSYAWFRSRKPDAVLGHALFLYHALERPAPDWAAVCFGFPLNDRQIRAGFGSPDLRLVYYDCAASQVYPAGEAGRFLLPPDAERPAGASLDLQARHADGTPAYVVLVAGEPPAPEQSKITTLDSPLTFLGYDVSQIKARPSQTVLLRTYWRVEGAPGRPLSLMAHLVGQDGAPIAVGDGLGFPVEQWQPGDLIVQYHRLAAPRNTLPGDYWLQTGVYWLDTGERWSTPSGGDVIVLDKITILD